LALDGAEITKKYVLLQKEKSKMCTIHPSLPFSVTTKGKKKNIMHSHTTPGGPH
jgi:hypothetical protein